MGSLPTASLYGLLAASVLVLAGCGPRPDDARHADAQALAADQPEEDVPPATAPPEAFGQDALARFDGYGDLRFGMTPAQIQQAWGGELRDLPEPDEADACHYLVPLSSDPPSEFAFMVEGGHFVRYDVRNPDQTAPGGGRVGMSVDEIRALYRGGIEEQPHKYVPDGRYLRIKADDGSQGVLVFEVDPAGRVTSWRVGVPPQADYVEGCS